MLIQKKKRRFVSPAAKKDILYGILVITVGFFGGMVDGFLGTGGGILMLLVLNRAVIGQGDKRDAFATALFCMVPLSVLSLALTLERGAVSVGTLFASAHAPLYAGALLGGMLGAYLLSRLKLPLIEALFAALLIFSGWRMLS